ncbi:Hypothetical predicted protein, partial [Mytilus galloprovincialis]
MRGFGGFFNKVKTLLTNKDILNQYLDHVTFVAVAGMCFPIYTIVRMHMKAPDISPLAKHKYALIGDNTITTKVEQEIRRKLGDPEKPLFFMKWRYTEIEKIESEEQFENLQKEEKPITLYLCTSSNTDLKSNKFFLPNIANGLPSTITKVNIVVMKRTEDNEDTINKCITSLEARSDINSKFDDTPVLHFTPQVNKDTEIQYEIFLLTIAVYILAAFIFVIRKKV